MVEIQDGRYSSGLHKKNVWMPPVCLDAHLYVWMPPCLDTPICLEPHVGFDAPICLAAPCMFGCPQMYGASKGMRNIQTYGGCPNIQGTFQMYGAYG